MERSQGFRGHEMGGGLENVESMLRLHGDMDAKRSTGNLEEKVQSRSALLEDQNANPEGESMHKF